MNRVLAAFSFTLMSLLSAAADELDRTMDAALATFEAVYPVLDATEFGVDVAAYRDALSLGRFRSNHWGGGDLGLVLERAGDRSGACGRFVAFVRTPPANGTVTLVVCPQFFAEGTPELRRLTILHEMVHVVAGPDECRAMAFAARIEAAATGTYTPVDRYWTANNCGDGSYRLP
jgi:hypothetical protein